MQDSEGLGEEEIPDEVSPPYDGECAAVNSLQCPRIWQSELINFPEEVGVVSPDLRSLLGA